jgi:hypothetical protein
MGREGAPTPYAKCSGDPGGSRTPNPQIRSLMLYPIQLRGRLFKLYHRLPAIGPLLRSVVVEDSAAGKTSHTHSSDGTPVEQPSLEVCPQSPSRPSFAPSAILPNALSALRQSFCGRPLTSCPLCGQRLKQACVPCSLPTEPVERRRCGHDPRQRLFFLFDGCLSRSALRVHG